METITEPLLEALGAILTAVLTALAVWLFTQLRNFLKNKRISAFMEALEKDHNAVYGAVLQLATAAEKMAWSSAHAFAKGDRYDYVKRNAVLFVNRLAAERGVPVRFDLTLLDPLIENAVLEAEHNYYSSKLMKLNEAPRGNPGIYTEVEKNPPSPCLIGKLTGKGDHGCGCGNC